jgi:TPR repeat protein
MKRRRASLVASVLVLLVSAGAQEDISTWMNKAKAGDPAAQVKVGQMYIFGQGVGRDSSEAAKWFRKAADQNYADGQYRLGVL